jgi:hypothetical protein
MSRITIQIADRITALVDVLEAECERDPGKFSDSPEERLLWALRTARDRYHDDHATRRRLVTAFAKRSIA